MANRTEDPQLDSQNNRAFEVTNVWSGESLGCIERGIDVKLLTLCIILQLLLVKGAQKKKEN